MAEDDEIDILGDCSLDSFLSKNETIFHASSLGSQTSDLVKCDDLVSQNSDLLKCDYTIHPQWLLDRPSTNPACWYSSTNELSSELGSQSDLEYNGNGVPQISTENSITDESGWTEKEKNLLIRGIEIFGKSNVRLSQFIGSKNPAEVKYYLKNFYTEVQVSDVGCFDTECIQETVILSQDVSVSDELIEDVEIPASIEEVISVVTTAKPTVSINKAKTKKRISNVTFKVNYNEIPSGQSLLKTNFYKHINKNDKLNVNYTRKKIDESLSIKPKRPKFKFKTKLKVLDNKLNNVVKRRTSTKSEADCSTVSETSDIEIVTGKGLSVPVCNGEEVVKITKENVTSDSDIEIDIEDSDDERKINLQENDENKKDNLIIKEESEELYEKSVPNVRTLQKKIPDLSELQETDVNKLMSMEVPKSEYALDENEVSELEKFMHFEFFEGRSTKTPMRYLKIRNHILNAWKAIKPSYVTKTSIRQGLKQCGDVNCIGRIHQFLEQIGAINFGCSQTCYIRPLYDLVITNTSIKDKSGKDVDPVVPQKFESFYRPRNKKKYINDGEGGYTLMHNERGEVINTTVVNEKPLQKQRMYLKKPIVRLIYCRSFNEDKQQEYILQIHLSVLLLMDFHAHMSLSEVMGLVGGRWDERSKLLSITRYEPCKNIAASSTHCDMCPITQAKAAEILHGENMDLLGWFHSHPTFAPEPSQQDIDTQLSVQQWIGNNKPCIGVIMSPFSSHGALISSPYRCMVVDKKENFGDQYVPYKFKVDVVSIDVNVDELLNRAWSIFNSDYVCLNGSKVDFHKPYFLDHSITYLDKFLTSVKMHLAKCSDVNKMTCDAILQGLSDICRNNL